MRGRKKTFSVDLTLSQRDDLQCWLRSTTLPAGLARLARLLKENADADIWNLTAFLHDELLPVIYASATATLANSGHEPFGLVGLEAMASGGVAFVGATG